MQVHTGSIAKPLILLCDVLLLLWRNCSRSCVLPVQEDANYNILGYIVEKVWQ